MSEGNVPKEEKEMRKTYNGFIQLITGPMFSGLSFKIIIENIITNKCRKVCLYVSLKLGLTA